MPRDIKIRVSYTADATFLSRLSRAVELDSKRSLEWRTKAIGHLSELIKLFVEPLIPNSDMTSEKS